jgi:hypothetical protein
VIHFIAAAAEAAAAAPPPMPTAWRCVREGFGAVQVSAWPLQVARASLCKTTQ